MLVNADKGLMSGNIPEGKPESTSLEDGGCQIGKNSEDMLRREVFFLNDISDRKQFINKYNQKITRHNFDQWK